MKKITKKKTATKLKRKGTVHGRLDWAFGSFGSRLDLLEQRFNQMEDAAKDLYRRLRMLEDDNRGWHERLDRRLSTIEKLVSDRKALAEDKP